MALRYDEFLGAGVRIVGVSVDSPGQHAAMIEKLQLPFALVSDPAGRLLAQLDAFNPDERGGIGRPGTFVYDTDGVLRFHQVGRDFADRITEDELVREALALELPATEQPTLEHVVPEPGDTAMPVRALLPYCRGAKFAAKAMGLRHPSAAEDSTRYVAQMDRYMEAVRELRARSGR